MSLLGKSIIAAVRDYSRIAPTERGGYRLARLARRFVPRNKWRGSYKTPNNLLFDLDLATYPDCCIAVGLYELDTVRLIRRILRPGMWFVDCGANLGQFTLLASRLVGRSGRVDAYEPDPLNLARLQVNLKANELTPNVRVHALAAADCTGSLELHHPSGFGTNHGMASAFFRWEGHEQRFLVPKVRLDEHLDGSPDLVKLDIEGGELFAVQGMRRLLIGHHPPSLIIEHNPATAKAAGFSPSELYRLMLEYQPCYRVFWIGQRLHLISSAEQLDRQRRHLNLFITSTE